MNERKYSSAKSQLTRMRFDYNGFFSRTRQIVEYNHELAEASLWKILSGNLARISRLEFGPYAIDGALQLLAPLPSIPTCPFFDIAGRASPRGQYLSLRGPRYLASIDPTLEVRQKLTIFERDFKDAVACILHFTADETEQEFWVKSSILDYAKNAAITLANATIQSEKLGNFRLDDPSYQQIRATCIRLATLATDAYYSHLLDRNDYLLQTAQILGDEASSITGIVSWLRSEYASGIFSSRFFTRPEASHPLVIIAFCSLVAEKFPNTNTIVGLPSGATELAIAQSYFFSLRNQRPDLLLLPYSLHSSKSQFKKRSRDAKGYSKYLRQSKGLLSGKRVLIVDDNSSTGRTVQRVADMLTRDGILPAALELCVAEADLVRSDIDVKSSKRNHIATHETYKMSVNVLPVSRTLKPKTDLREILETRRLRDCYQQKSLESTDAVTCVINVSYVRMLTEPTTEKLSKLNPDNSILRFRNTFLSNFHRAHVTYDGVAYNSVEHAYQAQKFIPAAVGSMPERVRTEMNAILARRGLVYEITNLDRFFTDQGVAAGSAKVIAEYLRREGYVRAGWDEMKVRIMADLLLQKFSHEELRTQLLETKPKYLVEINTWDDTHWGICDGQGRNLLGHLLMTIRDDQEQYDCF